MKTARPGNRMLSRRNQGDAECQRMTKRKTSLCAPPVEGRGIRDEIHPEQRKSPEANLHVLDVDFAKVFGESWEMEACARDLMAADQQVRTQQKVSERRQSGLRRRQRKGFHSCDSLRKVPSRDLTERRSWVDHQLKVMMIVVEFVALARLQPPLEATEASACHNE